MVSKLNHDCFRNILECLESNQSVLFKCLLVNRLWFEISIPYLWENPFSIVYRKGVANSRRLLKTIISMFPFEKSMEDKLNSCKTYKVTYHKYEQSFYNYLRFIKIFKSIEFHGFIDKCSRNYTHHKTNNENEEGTISSILSYHVYDIIFKNCSGIKQITLLTISKRIMKMKSFDNLSNLCVLEIGEIQYLEKIAHICKKIKKIVINLHGGFNNSQLLINFLKVQHGLKAVYLLSRFKLFQISNELLIQMHSIEELCIKNFILPNGQIITLSKLKRLEITVSEWTSQTVATLLTISCPILEVLKFDDSLPPLDVLAEFIKKTEGHLQCLHLDHPYEHLDTQVLLKSIAKSCPKIKSLAIIINITEDLNLLEHLLLSCNELKSLTLMSFDYIRLTLLQEVLRTIDENWKVSSEFSEYGRRIEFNKFHN
ncbi:uncharacterized protein OCT59_016646 [Rhizophagus irregularis]|uniref:F-box domain-containing protein n=5 Tax=Rhizophagus irregularis TaxID=588596 RepID=A0A015K0S8_RHIIW|nr:hypothetical protein GLOIN_2v1554125 [Rhizophagus irregularis DAOM 181602=DAOM 197198]EXX75387.1 hypothetical protein RirG_042220 [Rhizophagus irregularis DAOM 197198w]UZO24343.1 hypothetical protein OCT59_016646 [Rhizophagus irregularis]POG76596.1 hypothetical protein GLOIN_2v1554125 [Rhizophagus irregularis DAOM 181602=DAOM 197198]CAB4397926.1 unnamed protein product [Rhizophagus irregularis]CAB5189567.1 unnamed protein product [Rhizophagus irregularis]|eukprot:XP_025183462.1 hypothetical protein GLOIN_2v1554125 [Rhizophagus irregularis DAOM 181602=DAOM 197198]